MDASSRIFVKGLPPTITEGDFKRHFSFKGHDITEVRLFANRRIGYVGYKSAEDAQAAVKYFNKTFMRMSRIGVEIATAPRQGKAPTAKQDDRPADTARTATVIHDAPKNERDDAKLREFLEVMKPGQKKRAWESDVAESAQAVVPEAMVEDDDSEYETIPQKEKRQKLAPVEVETQVDADERPVEKIVAPEPSAAEAGQDDSPDDEAGGPITDEDWARSRTSRLLGLLDDDEEIDKDAPSMTVAKDAPTVDKPSDSEPEQTQDKVDTVAEEGGDDNIKAVRSTMRLFLRNLPFELQEDDLRTEFEPFGHIEEVHVSTSKKTGTGKGFAYIQFNDPDAAEAAFTAKDGQIFQGRLLHILPAAAKREDKLNDFELSKLPLKKQQQIQRRREAASSRFNWNTLYMNPDAVVSSVAAQLGIPKSAVLDPTSSDAAVKQAHAETHIIQETKSFFQSHGVDLDAFKRSQRGETAILVKNIPYDASKDDIKRMFEEHGQIRKFLMPPSGVIAIVEMSNAAQAKSAFSSLAYKRLKSSMLFLEKAPKDLFNAEPKAVDENPGKRKVSTTDLKSTDDDLRVKDAPGTATLFVRNLNFDTTTAQLTEAFKPLTGFLSARVKTKTDPKKPGQTLSMGFGFVEFRSASDAQAALDTMDAYTLHGHKLQVRASHRSGDAAEERRKAEQAKREAGQRTKIIIKNLPFETSKKEVRALFGAYGQLRSIRVPKKMDRAARGFAFADFTTPKEAQSAMDALRDTHLLGRRLVLDFADAEPADAEAEIEKMAAKVGNQTNAVAIQKLTGGGRRKFTTTQDDEEDT